MTTKTLGSLPDMLTVEEWRSVVRIGKDKAYQMIAQGAVKVIRFGRVIRIPKAAVERMLAGE